MNRKFALLIPALTVVGVAFAGVLIATLTATATVTEAFTTSETVVTWNAYPGETACDNVTITNAASNTVHAEFVFVETDNPDLVIYTTDMPKNVEIPSGTSDTPVCINISESSPIGEVVGNITITRGV